MAEIDGIKGEWVEIREAGSADALHLRRPSADIPPSRGSRRHLALTDDGQVEERGQGAVDKLEKTGSGAWSFTDRVLKLNIPGWEGDYDIETPDENTLILRRR